MCDCALLERTLSCGDDEQEEFVRPKKLRFLREKEGSRLYICPECETYWQVDHMERGPQAIKVSEPFSWERFDDRPFRLEFMVRHHGGHGTNCCIWRGCSDLALRGTSLCGRHMYPEYASAPR
jgi:hypothetical protein